MHSDGSPSPPLAPERVSSNAFKRCPAIRQQLLHSLARLSAWLTLHPSSLSVRRYSCRIGTPFQRGNLHCRAESVTAALLRDLCHKADLQCRGQEIIAWGGSLVTDRISVFTRGGSRWARENRVFVNRLSPAEAAHASSREQLYRELAFLTGPPSAWSWAAPAWDRSSRSSSCCILAELDELVESLVIARLPLALRFLRRSISRREIRLRSGPPHCSGAARA